MNRLVVALGGVILVAAGLFGLYVALDPIYWALLVWGLERAYARTPILVIGSVGAMAAGGGVALGEVARWVEARNHYADR